MEMDAVAGTKLLALELKAMKRPSLFRVALLEGWFPCVPELSAETRTTLTVQPVGAPKHVSRAYTC